MKQVVESVLAGQPDKVCDQIADAIVDEYLRRDPLARLDLQVMGSHGMLMIGGEIESAADVDAAVIARQVYRDIGYTDELEVFANLDRPSEDMRAAKGSADMVVVHGYATRQTRELLPRALVYAHLIARRLDDLRAVDPLFRWTGPDGKVQVVVDRDRVEMVRVVLQHTEDVDIREVQAAMVERVVSPLCGAETRVELNSGGRFVVGGFHADTGMSGHKTSVDWYGGLMPQTEAAASGKDPSKAERAGSYMARYVARQLLTRDLGESVFLTVGYATGHEQPIVLSAQVMTKQGPKDVSDAVREEFDFGLAAVVERLQLRQPIYRALACYGHVGRQGVPWE